MLQDIEEVIYAEFRTNDVYGESSDEFGFKAEVDEVFRCDALEILCHIIGLADDFSIETDFSLVHAFLDNICYTGERTADDEKDMPCVDDLFFDLAAFLKFHGGAAICEATSFPARKSTSVSSISLRSPICTPRPLTSRPMIFGGVAILSASSR